MSLYFALLTVENNKNKKSVKFQGDMLNFCDFIQVFVFTRNHHLNDTAKRKFKYFSNLSYFLLHKYAHQMSHLITNCPRSFAFHHLGLQFNTGRN